MEESAQTLRDYWEGHGHPGPSHGRERDEIAWGTPGDFDRCVVQVTAHGHMTEDQARGYCNLRHHGATGEWPAQHAAREKGKPVETDATATYARVAALVKAAGSQESRVPPGHVTGGQFTVGGDGPAPSQPNPFAHGKTPPFAKKPGKKPSGPSAHDRQVIQEHARARAQRVAGLKSRLHGLTEQLSSLEARKKSILHGGAGVHNFGTAASVKPSKPGKAPASSSSARTGSSSKPGKTGKPGSSLASRVQAIDSQINAVKQQMAQVRADLAQEAAQSRNKSAKPTMTVVHGEGDTGHDGDGDRAATLLKGLRNPRDLPTGRFRTFQGELSEARQALAEGRISDVAELLGSARALAQTDRQRLILGELQSAMGRVQHVPDVVTKCP